MERPETVLVVDDEPNVRKIVCLTLDSAGYKVLTAEGAREALALSADIEIDLLVSDVRMPEICGCELAIQMREKRPGIKVVLISGFPGTSNVAEAIARCQATFLAKPFRPQELIDKVRSALAID